MGVPAVRFEHVRKQLRSHDVLADVSFDVAPGEAFCILGRSGTGKSVTLKHMIGLMRPDSGRIYIDGEDITAIGPRRLAQVRRRMGFLFQSAALFDSITVGENVAFPLERHTTMTAREIRDRVGERLAGVGLGGQLDAMPADLSGGMQKRAALARAMALDPAILLVDEPSAGLDPITARDIDALLLEQKRLGTTLVIVTHNIPSARRLADRLVLLRDGRIAVEGTPGELQASTDPVAQQFLASEGAG